MDKELVRFLEKNNLSAELKGLLQKHKVFSIDALQNITDEQYTQMGIAIGEVAVVKSSLKKICTKENEEQRAQRIQSIVNKIRGNENKSVGKKSVGAAVKKSVKTRKMYVGWLHRSSGGEKYKQVKQLKDGGAVREITYREDEELTVQHIKDTAIKYFFPEGKCKYGSLAQMDIKLGNYAQEPLTTFLDTAGNPCSFDEYLKCRGLYSSKLTLYLMSSTNDENDETMQVELSDPQEQEQNLAEADNRTVVEDCRILVIKKGAEITPFSSASNLTIGYEKETSSSYSEEVVSRLVSFNRKDCFDMLSYTVFEILELKMSEFDPIDYGYTVCDIMKERKYYLSSGVSDDGETPIVQFPQFEKTETESLILHSPSEIWGYDGKQLLLGIVASCHKSSDVWYVWYQDDVICKEGNQNCCLPIMSPGKYKVEVRCRDRSEVSETVHVDVAVNQPVEACSSCTSTSSQSSGNSEPQLPVIDSEDIQYSSSDIIGSGSYGTVYRGKWAGTEVAIKQVKMRNAARLRSVVNKEAKVHSLARHPNIVQMMAISYTKNSIYLVSELVNGRNLEDLLFSDDSFPSSIDKFSVAKQLSQAVAYLHNLRPPIVHRDIKPANVLMDDHTHVTKLCDMGLSKLKSSHSVSMTKVGTVTGTPAYMAPECLINNKTATTSSDVWSLACTLLELFTEKECWEIAENDSTDAQKFITDCMRKGESPPSLSYLPGAVGVSRRALEVIICQCFNYKMDERPKALAIVEELTT